MPRDIKKYFKYIPAISTLFKDYYAIDFILCSNGVKDISGNNIKKLIHFSSVTAIGAGLKKDQILNEESKYNLSDMNMGYYESKRKSEEIALAAAHSSSLHVTAVNPSTIYGAGDAKKGSRNTQLKIAQGSFPFYTNGGVSVISVEDVVKATYRAWEVGKNGHRYILSGDNITIKELFYLIATHAEVSPPKFLLPTPILMTLGAVGDALALVNIKGPINSGNARAATLYNWFDNSKAKKELGLDPVPATVAVQNSVKWIKEQGLI